MKLLPFDLEKALNGAKLVTRDGREVTGFEKRLGHEEAHPFCYIGQIAKEWSKDAFTDEGKYYSNSKESKVDLFLLDEQPAPDLQPNYKRMYEMLRCIYNQGGIDGNFHELKDILLTAKID